MPEENTIGQRLEKLEEHLRQENPVLLDVVASFRLLDRVSQKLGFLDRNTSHATRVPWWPLISVLGLYSSGKSTFINHYLNYKLQETGNQAVDDKFTVICYSSEDAVRVLPGLAVDADPRLPFYQISEALDDVAVGEGKRIDAYLQLKTCPSKKLRGKILIDSPGFDADAQRTATLRITAQIIDLSDLVLVFFDARHPESGSMRETLEHLVNGTIYRPDSNKFLYILNQIDNAAREDNPEQVFAAWQRALAQHGLTAGRCYSIYDPEAAVPIQDPHLRTRFKHKRDADVAEISTRIEQVSVERAYRIVGMLHHTAHALEHDVVPLILRFMNLWRRRVLWLDGLLFGCFLAAFLAATIWAGYWDGLSLRLPLLGKLGQIKALRWLGALFALGFVGYVHFQVRQRAARHVVTQLLRNVADRDLQINYARAFSKSARWWRSLFCRSPAGWGRRARSHLARVLQDADAYVQKLNDLYTDISGGARTLEDVTGDLPAPTKSPLRGIGGGSGWTGRDGSAR